MLILPNLNTMLVFPVIHYVDAASALVNAQMAADLGCAGVFLISMIGECDVIPGAAAKIKEALPHLWVGINLLSKSPWAAMKISLEWKLDGTWSDHPGVTSKGVDAEAEHISALIVANPAHLFFGSIAFKYQAAEADPATAALNAMKLGMIPTTSGTATGKAAPLAKLWSIRRALGDRPLGIASGVTPANVREHAGLVTHVLVSTGISNGTDDFDRAKLAELLANAA